MRVAVRVVALLAFWLAMWGRVTPGNVVGGLAVIAVIWFVFPTGPGALRSEHSPVVRPIAAARFLVIFLWMLVVATYQVAVAVLRPRLRIAEGIVEVPLRATSPIVATMVADAITLTPGTMTVDVFGTDDGPGVLYVHALDLGDAEAIRADGHRLEVLAVRAFGSRADRERLGASR